MDTQKINIIMKNVNSDEFWNNEGWKNHIRQKCKTDKELANFVISKGELNKTKNKLFYEIATEYAMEN